MSFLLVLTTLLFAGAYAAVMEVLKNTWKALPAWEGLPHITPQTRVSIVVAARNEALHIGPCLSSLLGQTYPAGLFEIIVADDHSEDGTAEVVRSFSGQGVRLVRPAQPGKKQALQAGIEAASGLLIATVDADCVAPPAWLSAMVSYYEAHRPVLLAGPVTFFPGTNFRAWAMRVAWFMVMAERRDRARSGQVVFCERMREMLAAGAEERMPESDRRLVALRHCLERTRPQDRRLLDWKYGKGANLSDLAETTGCAATTVYKSISRLRLALRHCVEKRLKEEST